MLMPVNFHPNIAEGWKGFEFSTKGEYLQTRRALDEQICEQKDSIEVMKRKALSEDNSLKDVIGSLGARLQSTQNEIQQAVDFESRLRDNMSVEMLEANLRGSSDIASTVSTAASHSS